MNLNLILKHIEKYIVIATAIIVIILDIFNITSNYIIFEAILAVLALLMFSLIKFENKFDKLKLEGRLNNIKNFNTNRANLPSFEETFDKAKEEIVIWAACFGSGINKIRLIQDKLEQRCKVKILLMALLDENGNKNSSIEHAAEISKNTGLENRLNTAHKELRDFYTFLDKEIQNLLEIGVEGTELDILQKIVKKNQELPVIVVGRITKMDNVAKAFEIGADDFFRIPYFKNLLVEKLKHLH